MQKSMKYQKIKLNLEKDFGKVGFFHPIDSIVQWTKKNLSKELAVLYSGGIFKRNPDNVWKI